MFILHKQKKLLRVIGIGLQLINDLISDSATEFDISEIETLFSPRVQKPTDKSGNQPVWAKPEKIQLVMLNILNTWLLPDIKVFSIFYWFSRLILRKPVTWKLFFGD